MKYYEDLKEAGSGEDLIAFVLQAINEYKSSLLYTEAATAYEYFKKRNVTITQYKKLLYTLSGEAVPDNYSANYKFTNAFFPKFVRQENAFLLGNGVTFNNDATKEKLGGPKFDKKLYSAGEAALWGAVSFMFYNLNKTEVFNALEFCPFFGEEDGALHAGIRFWQVDMNKPLRATLYEEDGYTEFIWRTSDDDNEDDASGEILTAKRTYKEIVITSPADGTQILPGENYPGFPIVPLWANREHQSELTGLREKIDGYDLIQSGFANDLDDASQIYWLVQNASGMDELDLKKFLDQIHRVRAAVIEDDGAKAEAHTLDIPYEARNAALNDLRDTLYADAMALDTDKLQAGNVTATAIEAAYENLELKCDGYEYCVLECIDNLLKLIGIDDDATFQRRKTTNQPEVTQMVLSSAQYLDDETVLKKLPFLNIDEVKDIMRKKDAEEAERFTEDDGGTGMAEDIVGQLEGLLAEMDGDENGG